MYVSVTVLPWQHVWLPSLLLLLTLHPTQQFFWGDKNTLSDDGSDGTTPIAVDETSRYDYGVGPEDEFFSAENYASRERFVDYEEEEYYGYQPEQYNVQPRDPGTIPTGAASLAFVFDITGSMYDDLVQVIEGAAKILATTLSRRDKPLYNYVLVPFHDPGEYPVVMKYY